MRLHCKFRLMSVVLTICLILSQGMMSVLAYNGGEGYNQISRQTNAAVYAVGLVYPEINGKITIDSVEYTYMGDFTAKALNLASSPAGNNIYQAGSGYVLWNGTDKKITLHDASIIAYSALDIPEDASVEAEGENILTGTNSYALNCTSGGVEVKGSGSLKAVNLAANSVGWTYAINAGNGDVSIDIAGDFITGDASSGGICTQSGNVTIKSGGTVSVNGLIRAGNNVSVEAQGNLTITNEKNMAVQSINSGNISLSAKKGNIKVSGGNSYNQYSINGNNGIVTLDASGFVSVDDYNGYPGINGSSLELSGTIPEGTTLHSSCNVKVPSGKTLINNGTLFVNGGVVTVEGTLEYSSTASIRNGNGNITPTTAGNGKIEDESSSNPRPELVSTLDLRNDAPNTETQYNITTGGTAKWEPGSGGTANKLTLDNVTMSGSRYVVAVPSNTEIILNGTNSITAAGDYAVYSAGGLKITGTGSLNITGSDYAALYAEGTDGIDVNISGELSVTGQIRAGQGAASLKSGGEIAVNGSVYGMDSVAMEAGKSLSVINSSGAGVYAGSCTSVVISAKDGDLTVTGTGNYAVFGIRNTEIELSASDNIYITGNYGSNPYSIDGKNIKLSGTIPENTTLYTYCDVIVPAGGILNNNGTLRLYSSNATVTVDGILNNNGAIINGNGNITPTGSGTINEKAAFDFTKDTIETSGPGYSWDSTTKTLTLNGFDNTESAALGRAIVLPDGSSLILEGENKIASQTNSVIKAMGELEISGTGSLTGTAGGNCALDADGAVTIKDCTVSLATTTSEKSAINVIETNGNALVIDGAAKVMCEVKNQNDRGWGIHTGLGAVTVGKDAQVTVTGAAVGILTGSTPAPVYDVDVKIYGTLDTTGCSMCANFLGVKLDMTGSSIIMEEGTHIWLYQSDDTLIGETDVASFSGLLKVAGSQQCPTYKYHKITIGDKISLYAAGDVVSFTADTVAGREFSGWTSEGVALSDASAMTVSFTMPDNEVVLSANYETRVSGVTINVSELSLIVGDTGTLSAIITPADATNQNVSWSSDRPDIAEVDNNGVVTAKKAGTATITAETVDGGKTAVCKLTVNEALTPIIPGDTVRYIVEHYKANTSDSTGYVLADTEYPAGSIGETVTAVPKAYDGYTYNAEKSTASGILKKISSTDDIVTLMLYYDVTLYPVSVNGSHAAATGAGSYAEGDTVTLFAGTRNGYRFSGWTSDDGIIFADEDSVTTTFTMPDKAVTITANWESTDGNSDSGDSSPAVSDKVNTGGDDGNTAVSDKVNTDDGEENSFADVNKTDDNPLTGDITGLSLWLFTLCSSLGILIVILWNNTFSKLIKYKNNHSTFD